MIEVSAGSFARSSVNREQPFSAMLDLRQHYRIENSAGRQDACVPFKRRDAREILPAIAERSFVVLFKVRLQHRKALVKLFNVIH